MTKKQTYYQMVSKLVANALFHLYLTVAESSGYVTRAKRNEILVKYLKSYLKDEQYRYIKSEIRKLIGIGREKAESLEFKLIEVDGLLKKSLINVTDTQKLFDLLENVRVKHGVNTRFILNNEARKQQFVYLLRSHIENGFSDEGKQVAPVSLFYESPEYDKLEALINSEGLFKVEVAQVNHTCQQIHLILHPL
ncbi:DUF2913 family protein [Shewanella xiamenensis]|uniref:DUF2913 family protein n=1 Tax=Shewanella xiamenensis TaxID=332186 RepID=UPI00214F7930|nr:DUF2913 family protein [Shewanella xiamenensis]MCR4535492.1 DUF2913 family protein [Shewanella xiamenensis]